MKTTPKGQRIYSNCCSPTAKGYDTHVSYPLIIFWLYHKKARKRKPNPTRTLLSHATINRNCNIVTFRLQKAAVLVRLSFAFYNRNTAVPGYHDITTIYSTTPRWWARYHIITTYHDRSCMTRCTGVPGMLCIATAGGLYNFYLWCLSPWTWTHKIRRQRLASSHPTGSVRCVGFTLDDQHGKQSPWRGDRPRSPVAQSHEKKHESDRSDPYWRSIWSMSFRADRSCCWRGKAGWSRWSTVAQVSWVWICTSKILHNITSRQIYDIDNLYDLHDLDRDVSDVRTTSTNIHDNNIIHTFVPLHCSTLDAACGVTRILLLPPATGCWGCWNLYTVPTLTVNCISYNLLLLNTAEYTTRTDHGIHTRGIYTYTVKYLVLCQAR